MDPCSGISYDASTLCNMILQYRYHPGTNARSLVETSGSFYITGYHSNLLETTLIVALSHYNLKTRSVTPFFEIKKGDKHVNF